MIKAHAFGIIVRLKINNLVFALGCRLMVGQQPLELFILVRIQASQRKHQSNLNLGIPAQPPSSLPKPVKNYMRKIITTTFVTLDGVMQAPGGPTEDTSSGFKYGGWQMAWDEKDNAAEEIMINLMAEHGDLLLGKLTYDIWVGFWPKHKDEDVWGKAFDKAEKFVVSHNSFDASWDKLTAVTGDVAKELKMLKETDGPDLWVCGSSNLIQTLLKNNLIDRMHVWIYPITLGAGKKLFAEGTQPERFKVVNSKVTDTGVLFATYEPSTSVKINTRK